MDIDFKLAYDLVINELQETKSNEILYRTIATQTTQNLNEKEKELKDTKSVLEELQNTNEGLEKELSKLKDSFDDLKLEISKLREEN